MRTIALALLCSASYVAAQNYWFSFGDSYTATGFNPAGTPPSSGNPLGNPAYPGATTTGGENWVDYLTTTFNKSEIFTYNYAYGGAIIDPAIVPTSDQIVCLSEQINDEFLLQIGNVVGWTSENSLFSIFIGINDIGKTYRNGGDRNAFSDTLLDAYFGLVQQLYDAGGRNFLFVGVPPVERSPLNAPLGADTQALEKSVIDGYNVKLVARVDAFKTTHEDVSTWIWDTQIIFNNILNDPTAYGFRDGTTAGSDPDLFWGDSYHPSSAGQKYMAQAAAEVLAGTIW